MLSTRHYDLIPHYRNDLLQNGPSRCGNRGLSAQFKPPTYANGGDIEGVIVERQVMSCGYKRTSWFGGERLKKWSSTVTGLCVGGGWNGAHVGLPTHVVFPEDWLGGYPWGAEVRCYATFIPCKADPFSPGPAEEPAAMCERLGLVASAEPFPTYGLEEDIDPLTGVISGLQLGREDIRWHEPWNPAQPKWDLLRTFAFEQNYNSVLKITVRYFCPP